MFFTLIHAQGETATKRRQLALSQAGKTSWGKRPVGIAEAERREDGGRPVQTARLPGASSLVGMLIRRLR